MDMITEATHVAAHEAARQGMRQAARQTPVGGEYLTFRLGAEEYGIDILKVQEIRSYEVVEHGPRTGLLLGGSSTICPATPWENIAVFVEGLQYFRQHGRE